MGAMASFAMETSTHQLVLGQSIRLTTPRELNLYVHKKGIVDVTFIESGAWQVTGLKKGFVLITGRGPDGESKYKAMVEVKRAEPTRSSRSSLWQSLCEELGCDPGRLGPHQAMSDFGAYFRLYELCLKDPSCYFQATLAKPGRDALLKLLKASFPGPLSLQTLSQGKLLLRYGCSESHQKEWEKKIYRLLQISAKTSPLQLICQEERVQSYQLKAKIFSLEKGSMEGLGWDFAAQNLIQTLSPKQNQLIQAYLTRNEKNLISQPTLSFRDDEPVKIHSGEEIAKISSKDDPEQHWRKTGFRLHFQFSRLSAQRGIFRYEASLSAKSGEGGDLSSSYLNGELVMELSQPTIVFEMTSLSQDKNVETLPILESIPILGPLFQKDFSGHHQKQVYLWVLIEPLPP